MRHACPHLCRNVFQEVVVCNKFLHKKKQGERNGGEKKREGNEHLRMWKIREGSACTYSYIALCNGCWEFCELVMLQVYKLEVPQVLEYFV